MPPGWLEAAAHQPRWYCVIGFGQQQIRTMSALLRRVCATGRTKGCAIPATGGRRGQARCVSQWGGGERERARGGGWRWVGRLDGWVRGDGVGGHLASWLLRASSYGGTGIECSVAFAAAAAAVGSVAASSRAAQSEVSTFAVSAGRSSAAKVAPLVVAPGLCWTSHFPCSSTNASGKGREATELRYALMWSCAWKRRDDEGEASDVGKMRSKRSEL